ncbi:MAG: class I SAM-dependent methyltransferase [Candidatus Paceibacterota bacterium]
MSDLANYFYSNKGRRIHKWTHFFDIYDRHLSQFRGQTVTMLEVGISRGGSLEMWKEYFKNKIKLYAVDVKPECKQFEEENVRIFIGDQADRHFLKTLQSELPSLDIVIDDGGHTMEQQIRTFEELFGSIKEGGVYLCEDTHTSYKNEYGGGYKKSDTFIEYIKDLVDALHAYHSEDPALKPDAFATSIGSVHFYDGIVVVEKRKRKKPVDKKTGGKSRFKQKVRETVKGEGVVGVVKKGVRLLSRKMAKWMKV